MTLHLRNFHSNLNKMIVHSTDSQHILQINYAYLISCMETYLSCAMWKSLDEYPKKYINLAQGMNNTAKLRTIYAKGLPAFIEEALANLQYHNLSQVKIHYKNAFNITFPLNLSLLLRAIGIRHDIVHRCGHSKQGKSRSIGFEEIEALTKNISSFIENIDKQLESKLQEWSLSNTQ